jgi:hypothetical protein
MIRIVPFGRGSTGIKNTAAPAGAHLTYFGGPVISNISVVAVFWGPNVTPVVTANGAIDQFYTDITSSRFFDLLTEYSTAGTAGSGAGASTNQSIGHGSFLGKVTITPSLCPGPAACTVTDTQIQTELTNQINAHVLPAPTTDLHGIINTYYAIYFPPGVTINDGTSSSCVKGGFCAYHSDIAGTLAPYGVLPDFTASACSLGCGAGTPFQNISAVSSHEMSEAITNSEAGSANVFGPPLAWYDGPTPNLGEVADLCNGQDVTVSAGANSYSVQQDFSNLQGDCVSAPPVFRMSAGAATLSTPFNLTLRVQSSTGPTLLTGYSGTVHFTSSDAQAVLPADYTFVAADGGSHVFSVTMNSTGSQTINVVDTHSSGFNGSLSLFAPIVDLQAAVAGGALSQGQTGASYTTSIANVGTVASSGLVTVNITVGSELTPTALSGTGWTCVLATLSCTRSDVLGGGLAYPDITLVFNVAANAPAFTTLTATVSGGSDANSANNSDSIKTTVNPVFTAPPTITATPPDVTVTAGQPAPYVFGIGAGTGVGTVTFSCSGLPTTAFCSFSPTSLATSGNVTMTITTTARSSTFGIFSDPGNRNPLLILLLSLAAFITFSLGLTPRRRRLVPALGITGVLFVGMLVGCGGGGSSAPPPIIGTQAGTFPITFTATGPAGAASKTVNLIVR